MPQYPSDILTNKYWELGNARVENLKQGNSPALKHPHGVMWSIQRTNVALPINKPIPKELFLDDMNKKYWIRGVNCNDDCSEFYLPYVQNSQGSFDLDYMSPTFDDGGLIFLNVPLRHVPNRETFWEWYQLKMLFGDPKLPITGVSAALGDI